ncbi:LPXTG cell wall anchor domain-containing protein [Georgenia sp. MJ206]|uniref:LPXTG cell wall anchor domain-containing protein n=1 Tax=Georgenia wangjunii TaxID=3117730 RepID=UPI002F2610A9
MWYLTDTLLKTDRAVVAVHHTPGGPQMFRRALAGAITAVLLVFAPTAAFGYNQDDYDAAVSTTNPDPGQSFTVVVEAPSGTDVTLTISADGVSDDAIQIAGTKSLTKTATDGMATFTVTLSEEAVYDLVATAEDGTVIETFAITVGDPAGAGDGATDGPGAGAGQDGDDVAAPGLPETGATATPLLIGGAVLLVIGAGIVFFMRRRNQQV